MTDIERIAKAIWEATSGRWQNQTWEEAGGETPESGTRVTSMNEARAAVEALLAASDDVISAGIRAGVDVGFGVGYDDYRDIFQAMLRQVLK